MLKHWTIARQMAVGMGGLCVAILLIAGIANLATATLSGVFREYRAAANGSSAAVAVMQNLYQARLASLKARIDGGGGYADQVRASIDAVRAAEPELARLIVGTGGEAARMAVLADNLARYEFAFNTALQRQSQRDLLVGQLNEYAAEVETSLNKIITIMSVRGDRRSASASIKAMRAYLEGRAGFGRYLVSNDDADLKDTLTSFQKARAALVIMDREDAAESSERLNGMAGLLEEAALAIRARNQSYATMDAIGPMIIEDMRAMQGALVAKQGRLGPEGETLVRRFEAIMLAAALSLSLTGAMLAWWLSRRVSRRLKRSVASLTALADGDMEAKIVGQDRRTELGSMARAMVRFRDNLKETRRLEREALEKERRDRAEDAARAAAAEEKQARKARERAEEEERRRRETARRETEERRAAEARELAAQQRQEAARRRVIEELRDAVGAVVDAAVAGDFSRRIDAGFEDETLARLAGRINELIASVERGVSAAAGAVSGIAKGDLRLGMQGEFAGAFAGLQADVGETIRGLTDMIADIAESGETVHGGATEITARADDLAKRTESAAASIEQTAAAVGEISESLGQVSVNVAEATVVANEARRRAEEGGKIVRTAVSAMDAVAGSSQRIASIIDVIEDISFQINLLALNAGVEAARAGDAGRGFSVVAAEVRALALRTSDAVHDVTGLINESVANVDRGARSVDEASSALTGIAGGVVDIAERMAAIASAVEEQSSGVGEINQAISGLDRSTQDNAAMFEEVSAACHTLTASAESLRASIGRFTVAKTRARAA